MKRPLYLITGLAVGVLVVLTMLRDDDRAPTTRAAASPVAPSVPSAWVHSMPPTLKHVVDDPVPTVAPPPRLASESLIALRDEVYTDVRSCTADAIVRHPTASGRLAIAYQLRISNGRLNVIDVTTTGLDDDALATCVAAAGRRIELAAADQQDGVHTATVFFDLP
jgi:hypothetical protein